jgi:outer membrane protein OmpA-like peptidoglycan-associated protein
MLKNCPTVSTSAGTACWGGQCRLKSASSRRTKSPAKAQSSSRLKSAAGKYAYLVLCGLSLAVASAVTASAEELSHEEMVCALDPSCTVPIVDRRVRGVSATSSVRTRGSFDRTVNFAFNSAELTPEARKELDKVAAVLTDPNIEKYTIIIHGHTDDIGTAQYNQLLSERRAEAARQYFITQHGIDAKRLIARGHGKSQLLIPTDPTNELNRRVQFENANYAAASAAPVAPAPGTARPAPAAVAPAQTGASSPQTATSPGANGEGL